MAENNPTNLNQAAITLGQLDKAVADIVAFVKQYTTDHPLIIDTSAEVKAMIDEINGIDAGETALAKLAYTSTFKQGLATLLLLHGYDMTGAELNEYTRVLARLLKTTGIYIVCRDNGELVEYTKEVFDSLGVKPTPVYMLVRTATDELCVSGKHLSCFYSGSLEIPDVNTPKSSTDAKAILSGYRDTWRVLRALNPEVLRGRFDEFGIVELETTADFPAVGDSSKVYIVKKTSGHDLYRFDGNSYVKKYAVPFVANSVTGSPLAEFCWQYKAYEGDENEWYTSSAYEALIIYANLAAINSCIASAINVGLDWEQIPATTMWTILQYSSANAWNCSLSNGSLNNNGTKCSNSYLAVPVSAYQG
ncbi:MAG: hypothetical protein MJZ64_00305 [Paludibacteraceae bacterium]|nr:hypothetical protein [Paludibacteraceae bacterium]